MALSDRTQTAANLIVAVGNYLFQTVMQRHLSWNEFGYLNATLSLILFAGVPLTRRAGIISPSKLSA